MAAITLDEAKERIRRLAEERPDFVYESVKPYEGATSTVCVYFDKAGEPSCIVGHAFADELRAAGVDFDTRATVPGLVNRGHLDLDRAAQDFLKYVQGFQDSGTPWRDAYTVALRYTAEE